MSVSQSVSQCVRVSASHLLRLSSNFDTVFVMHIEVSSLCSNSARISRPRDIGRKRKNKNFLWKFLNTTPFSGNKCPKHSRGSAPQRNSVWSQMTRHVPCVSPRNWRRTIPETIQIVLRSKEKPLDPIWNLLDLNFVTKNTAY